MRHCKTTSFPRPCVRFALLVFDAICVRTPEQAPASFQVCDGWTEKTQLSCGLPLLVENNSSCGLPRLFVRYSWICNTRTLSVVMLRLASSTSSLWMAERLALPHLAKACTGCERNGPFFYPIVAMFTFASISMRDARLVFICDALLLLQCFCVSVESAENLGMFTFPSVGLL